jgi:hypothetical protein
MIVIEIVYFNDLFDDFFDFLNLILAVVLLCGALSILLKSVFDILDVSGGVFLILVEQLFGGGVILVGFLQNLIKRADDAFKVQERRPVIFENWHEDFAVFGMYVKMIDFIEEEKMGRGLGVGFGDGELETVDHFRVEGI